MLQLLMALLTYCDFGPTDHFGQPNPGLCYDRTPFGDLRRRPTLHEAFGENNP